MLRNASLLTLVVILAISHPHAQKPAPIPQREFTAEDDAVHHPGRLPDSAFNALAHDKASKIDGGDGSLVTPARDWYSAEKLRPPAPNIELYMVMARAPLTGANVDTFWLVQNNTRTQRATILWTMPTHSVSLRYTSDSGYPEINTVGMSSVHVWESTFRYRGKYVLARAEDYDIGSRGHH